MQGCFPPQISRLAYGPAGLGFTALQAKETLFPETLFPENWFPELAEADGGKDGKSVKTTKEHPSGRHASLR
ncbi:hypothetical protein Q31b_22690 [Novipirellula aureliae]|uniref:Uncharacterized protein n=1 Tax=Novipirellula aureliae TaxID=2527966 RepID=A0A5C6E6G4_9BACT|nr:hypothetical protein [Novipirellula aureliae]TWU43231.1 hypothetical protein Q31b_22690 [Novipirellula aureliae]